MLDKEQYPKLYEAVENKINMRMEFIREAIRAQILCELLPEEIKVLEITDIDYSRFGKTLNLTIRNTEGCVRLLKELGVQGLKPQVSSWSKRIFFTEGKGRLPNNTEFTVHISGIEEPEGCIIKEERSVSKSYILVCEQSDEEIK